MTNNSVICKNVYKYDDMKRAEHMAVRNTAGWYLFTHQLLDVTGKDAARFLDYVFPNSIATLAVGRDRYTTMLDEKGEIIDDVVVFRVAEDRFVISTLFIFYMEDWFNQHKEGFDVSYQNITESQHMYSVQGPNALAMVNALVEKPVDDLKFFSFAENSIDGEKVYINRAGFTGEKYGYEIYIAADKRKFLYQKLVDISPKFEAKELEEFQIFVWTLSTEAGYYYLRDIRHTNPLEVGLDKGINWDKDFIGKEALLKVKEEGPAREMVGFTTDELVGRIDAKDYGGYGDLVIIPETDEAVGRVVKFNYSYVNEKPIGYLLVKKGSVKVGDHVFLNAKYKYDAVITEKRFI